MYVRAKRLLKILAGFTLLAAGVVMWVTPGPGWAAVIGGLVLLSTEFEWACRLLTKIKEKGGQLRDAVVKRPEPRNAETPSCVKSKPNQDL